MTDCEAIGQGCVLPLFHFVMFCFSSVIKCSQSQASLKLQFMLGVVRNLVKLRTDRRVPLAALSPVHTDRSEGVNRPDLESGLALDACMVNVP